MKGNRWLCQWLLSISPELFAHKQMNKQNEKNRNDFGAFFFATITVVFFLRFLLGRANSTKPNDQIIFLCAICLSHHRRCCRPISLFLSPCHAFKNKNYFNEKTCAWIAARISNLNICRAIWYELLLWFVYLIFFLFLSFVLSIFTSFNSVRSRSLSLSFFLLLSSFDVLHIHRVARCAW